jgi:diadenylate cyclase
MDHLLDTWAFKTVIRPLLDVSVLTFLLYKGYRILYQTRAIPLLRGIILMVLIYALAVGLKLDTLTWILNFVAPGIFVGLAIVFQPELRKIFTQIGQGGWFTPQAKPKAQHVDAVLASCRQLSEMRRGALITFIRKVGLKNIVERGTNLDAEVSAALLTTIFSYDTPLHDGGLIIQGGRIVSAGCFYPLSENPTLSKSFGTRHRASLGLAEESDAVTVVVSEETGAISLAYNGALHYDLSAEELRRRLKDLREFKDEETSAPTATEFPGGEFRENP